MGRALALIDEGAPLAQICASIKNEASYQSVADLRKLERQRRQVTNNREKTLLDRKTAGQARNFTSVAPSVIPATPDVNPVGVGRYSAVPGNYSTGRR